MEAVHPYLTFHGNCEVAFEFYKQVFGGEFTYLGRFSDIPPGQGMEVPESEKDKIMHVSLPLGKNTILMGSDAGGDWGKQVKMGNNMALSITAESKEEADRIFDALAKGGEVIMPMGDVFWGSYYGMCKDKYGISWMISYGQETNNQ
ncbi:MAG: VOC family protein [Salinimicrobium sp.]